MLELSNKIDGFEKLELVSYLLEVEGIDLIECGDADRKYYIANCPLHDDKNPSFVVWENTQRCKCYSCWEEGGDIIDFVRRKYGLSFVEAVKKVATPLDTSQTIDKLLEKLDVQPKIDKLMFAKRAKNLFKTLDIQTANGVLYGLNQYLSQHRLYEADLLLKNNGV